MKKIMETQGAAETKKLGRLLARELRGGEIIALIGDLGSGKTTFTQGLLDGLGAEGPFTSPTFIIMRHYNKEAPISKSQFPKDSNKINERLEIRNIYHLDAYRVNDKDIMDLGWEEIISDKKNVVIVEWADRVEKILPKDTVRIEFWWLDEKKRRISINSSLI